MLYAASAGTKLHQQRVPRAQCYFGLDFRWRDTLEDHSPALSDGRNGEDAFHPRETFADALTAAPAEREVGKAGAICLVRRGVAVRVEAERVGEILGATMHDVLTEEKVRSRWNAIGPQSYGTSGHATHRPCGRIESHGFGEDLFGVTEIGVFGERGSAGLGPGAENGVELGVQPGLGFGVLAEKVPGPGQGIGYGFIACKEDGEDFVANLFIGHSGLIACSIGLVVS